MKKLLTTPIFLFIIYSFYAQQPCPNVPVIYDIVGNEYSTVYIDSNCWMAENLKTHHYSDGTSIPLITSDSLWHSLDDTSKAYCYYNNDTAFLNSNGGLYTWAAAMNGSISSNSNPSNIQGVCPNGWHLPSDSEWDDLAEFIANDNGRTGSGYILNGTKWMLVGGHLKSTNSWYNGQNGTNDYGFNGFPHGYRDTNGVYFKNTKSAYWWPSTETSNTDAIYRSLDYTTPSFYWHDGMKSNGFSVRCIKDSIYSISSNLVLDTFICYNEVIHFNVNDPGNLAANIIWSTGQTTDSIDCTIISDSVIWVSAYDINNNLILSDTSYLYVTQVISAIFGDTIVYPYSTEIYYTNQNLNSNYYWIVTNGTIISGQGTNSITVNWENQGTGLIELLESDSVCLYTILLNVEIRTDGINDNVENYINVQPNPSTGIFNIITSNGVQISEIEIYDILGNLVYVNNFNEKDININLNQVKGIYLVKVYFIDGKQYLTRIVVN